MNKKMQVTMTTMVMVTMMTLVLWHNAGHDDTMAKMPKWHNTIKKKRTMIIAKMIRKAFAPEELDCTGRFKNIFYVFFFIVKQI